MKSSYRTLRVAACVAALFAALGVAHAADSVKIALALPMSGPNTQYGDMVKAGALTAIEQINDAGGVDGRKLEAVMMDDACEPKQGPIVANRVVSENIHFVIGHVCSGATIPASDIYEREGVVMITPSATSPVLTEGRKRHFIFRTIGRDDQQGPAAARYILDKVKPKRVAVLHDKQTYGEGIATSVKRDLEAAKIPVPLFEGINAGDTDYSAMITKLKTAHVDFVYFGGYHPEMGLLLRQAREQGLQAAFMGPEGVGNKGVTAIAGPASEGMLVTLPADFSADPANAALVKAFAAKKRDSNGAFQMPAYAAAVIIADSIKGARSVDPAKIAAYIHSHSFKTPIGTVSYDKQGDLKAFKFDIFVWHKDATKTPAP
ncbi:MAG: branched-chain amino acid ABC transporter substrate-binding protein [Burkholderiaceae bacterium]|jgi:branched-chain amino acid transport system substrate-binding protein|nr:branched-chain amino acid ABC transporter substrate-binding protein [Burkholderiaceae bacterium]